MLSLRQMKEKPKDPLQAFQEFFQTYRDPSWVEYEQLQYDSAEMTKQNLLMAQEIQQLQVSIE